MVDHNLSTSNRLVGATTLRIAYGYTVQEGTDPLLTLVEEASHSAEAVMTPGIWLVDTLPFLRYLPGWVPGAGFKQVATESRRLLLDMVNVPYELAKKISVCSLFFFDQVVSGQISSLVRPCTIVEQRKPLS